MIFAVLESKLFFNDVFSSVSLILLYIYRLGNLASFEQEFSDPIRIGGYAGSSHLEVDIAFRTALQLQTIIRPFLLRRRKEVHIFIVYGRSC